MNPTRNRASTSPRPPWQRISNNISMYCICRRPRPCARFSPNLWKLASSRALAVANQADNDNPTCRPPWTVNRIPAGRGLTEPNCCREPPPRHSNNHDQQTSKTIALSCMFCRARPCPKLSPNMSKCRSSERLTQQAV